MKELMQMGLTLSSLGNPSSISSRAISLQDSPDILEFHLYAFQSKDLANQPRSPTGTFLHFLLPHNSERRSKTGDDRQ